MRLFGVALVAALALSAHPVNPHAGCPPLTPVQAARSVQSQSTHYEASPVTAISTEGFEPYCARRPRALLCAGGWGYRPTLAQVQHVDGELRAQFEYRGDDINYGVNDEWRDPVICGDCEDYALSLADHLHAIGVGGRFLRLAVWAPGPTYAHATLLVDTSDAGVIEVGVGNGTPQVYDPKKGTRFATMRFDGRRRWQAEPGVRVTAKTVEIMPAVAARK